MRFAALALLTCPLWACATGVDNAPAGTSPLNVGGADGEPSDGGSASGGSGSTSAGSASGGSSAGALGVAGSGASGAPSGKAGAGSAGSGSAGAGSAGKGGIAGSGSGGASAGSGSGGAGASAGASASGGASAGSGSAGAGAGGVPNSTGCDAGTATVTVKTSGTYTGKANDCVRLHIEPGWATINPKFIAQPGSGPYPVPFSFFSCKGDGTGSLTADYVEVPLLKNAPNPGCDLFVQFGGGATTIIVNYYD